MTPPHALVVAILLPATLARAAAPAPGTTLAPGHYPLIVRKVHDGDTIRGDIALPWKVGLLDRDVRLLGFDAWEATRHRRTIGPITEDELRKGARARIALEALLRDSAAVDLEPGPEPFDAYGRPLGRLRAIPRGGGPPIDVADWMTAHGHARNTRR